MAAYITVGAKTTHGGEVITGSPHTTHNGIPVSRKGDKVICRKCKKLTTILTGDPSFIVDGSPIARGGDVTSCGAKLIAIQESFCEGDFEVMGVAQPEPLQFPKSDMSNSFAEGPGEQIEHYQPRPIRRVMTGNEIALALTVFGDSINYIEVGIYEGKWKPFQGDGFAMAPNGNIYFPTGIYEKDFSSGTDEDKRLFMHEMTHVWQYQNGQAVLVRGFFAQIRQRIGIEAYKYELDGKDLLNYGIEQQAAIVSDFYSHRDKLKAFSLSGKNPDNTYLKYIDTLIKFP